MYSEVSLGCVQRHVPIGTGFALAHLLDDRDTGTGPAEVMERQRWNLTDLCFLFNHAPDDLGTEAATPDSASFVNGPKQNATRDSGSCSEDQRGHHQAHE